MLNVYDARDTSEGREVLDQATRIFRDDMQLISSLLGIEARRLGRQGNDECSAVLASLRIKADILNCLSVYEMTPEEQRPKDMKSGEDLDFFELMFEIITGPFGEIVGSCKVDLETQLAWSQRRGIALILHEVLHEATACALIPGLCKSGLELRAHSGFVEAELTLGDTATPLSIAHSEILAMLIEQHRCNLSHSHSTGEMRWTLKMPIGDANDPA